MNRFLHIILFSLLTSIVTLAQDFNKEAAVNHINNNLSKLSLTKDDVKNLKISSEYISPTTKWYHIYFNQTFNEIDVYNGILNVTMKDGHLIHIGNNFVPNLSERIGNSTVSGLISPTAAINNSFKSLNLVSGNLIAENVTLNTNGLTTKAIFKDNSISDDPIGANLVWYIDEKSSGNLKKPNIILAWNVSFLSKDKQNGWDLQINAKTGEIITTKDNVIKCEFGHRHAGSENLESCNKNLNLKSKNNINIANSYNVFDYGIESPIHGNRSLSTNPYNRFAPANTGPGSTNGWHQDGTNTFTDTRGNNVYAQEDANADNSGGVRPNPINYTFDYPYTQGLGTSAANQNASITNLFYWNNLIHDALYMMGFDEPSGNFQTNNLNRNGLGNDHVFADAQDGSGSNNANFYTPTDGSNPRMQMFLWNYSTTYQADSDFDNAIIAHEYGHGWSIRLTGGPANSSCLSNVEQGGEGWSDYLGLMLTTNWASLSPNIASANIPRGIGTYVLGTPTTGPGIRPYKYSYDMANINPIVKYGAVANTSFSQPHGIGSIWCTMLWDMTWEIILSDNHIDPNVFNVNDMRGNVAALKLVNEGLRLQPCSPSFVQARDAILAADAALFQGRYKCAISRAFSRRGLGKNASSGVSSNDRIITEDFTQLNGPTITSTTALNSCSGSIINYTLTTSDTLNSIFWVRNFVAGISNPAANGNTNNITENLVNTTNLPIKVFYVFTLNSNICGSVGNSIFTLEVTVDPTVITPLVSTYTICQNQNVPVGEGLKMPASIISNLFNINLNTASPLYYRSGSGTPSYYYKTNTFIAPTSGTYVFEVTSSSIFDTYLYLYQGSFNPSSASNYIAADDDSGIDAWSKITINLTQGQTYILVFTTFNTFEIGTATVTASQPIFSDNYLWFNSSTANNNFYSGNLLNPVGVLNSGIPNTFAPINKTYYVGTSLSGCRIPLNFTVSAATVSNTLSGLVSSSNTLCPIFNQDTLRLSAYTGNVLGWEVSSDNFTNVSYLQSSNPNLPYKGLTSSKWYRAVMDRGNCNIAKSKAAKLYVVKQTENLSDTLLNDTLSFRAAYYLNSQEKIKPVSKVDYIAGKSINLNPGFISEPSTIFLAKIEENTCYFPDSLVLRSGSGQSMDGDISSLFPKNNYKNIPYLVPYTWIQFGNQETRRSLLKFDINSIPANAVIDSAFIDLYYSAKFVQENPPFTGHFGTNSFQISRITQAWSDSTLTWNNQPTVTAQNSILVAAATNSSKNYLNINIKNIVIDQILNNNNGFMIRHQIEDPYKITCLTSGEEPQINLRPRIRIYYRYK